MAEIEVMFVKPAKEVTVTHENLGTVNKNAVRIGTEKGMVRLYFSYNTLVAVDNLVSENDWSKTTGKLLNELEPDKKSRVPHKEVLQKAQEKLKRVLY